MNPITSIMYRVREKIQSLIIFVCSYKKGNLKTQIHRYFEDMTMYSPGLFPHMSRLFLDYVIGIIYGELR